MNIKAWSATNGDPTVWGWLIVVAYFVAAFLCAKKIRRFQAIESDSNRTLKTFWILVCTLLLTLGINKQLDIQSLITFALKDTAIHYGWYDQRRIYQEWFILSVLFLALTFTISLSIAFKSILKDHILAVFGMVLLIAFVAIRASSFHHMDHIIGLPIFGTNINFVLEMTGIFLIAVNALRPSSDWGK